MNISELRHNGYKIRVHHFRKLRGTKGLVPTFKIKQEGKMGELELRGGLTEISITSPDGKTATAEARCGRKDLFNRKMGVSIALGRALKILAGN